LENSQMIRTSCHCGAVGFAIETAPTEVTQCNCSICRRYGVLWAYYPLAAVRRAEDGPTDTYEWDDRSIAFHRCRACGCVTHWSSNDPGRDKIGINARLMEPQVLAAARVRRLDGAVSEQYVD